MSKENILIHPLRRRTNSHAGIPQQCDLSWPSALNHVRRLRRTSFTLSGERPDSLDELINAAVVHASTAAVNREVAAQEKATNGARRRNISIEGQLCTSPVTKLPPNAAVNTRQTDLSTRSSEELVGDHSNSTIQLTGNTLDEHEHVWYNNVAFSSNPLKSSIIKEYLARIAVNSSCFPSPDIHLQSKTSATLPPLICKDNFLLSTLPSAAISTSSHSLPTRSMLWHGCKMPLHSTANAVGRSLLSDVSNRPSSTSVDFHHQNQLGYHSDTGLLDSTVSKPRQPVSASHRRQLLTNYTKRSNLIPLVKKFSSVRRSDVQGRTTAGSVDVGGATNPTLRFDVNHFYDGFPVSSTTSSQSAADSTGQLSRAVSALHVADSPAVSDDEDGSHAPSTGRLRSLFRQLRPAASSAVESAAMAVLDAGGDFSHSDNDYFYPNQEAQERRTKAHVTNMITPVSF